MSKLLTKPKSIPKWAAELVGCLQRDRPAVVTRQDLEQYSNEVTTELDIDKTVVSLQKLGWLASLHLKGVWAFVPVGEEYAYHPYLDLYAWRARDQNASCFLLAGEAAAWHLGYLPRRFEGKIALWLPQKNRIPHGIRSHFTLIPINWESTELKTIAPSTKFLHKKRLDLITWSGGLPAFGPEALVAQLALRPSSFRAWEDLVPQLDIIAEDCDIDILKELLKNQSTSAWQRTAYIFDRAGKQELALKILADRPRRGLIPKVEFGQGLESYWSKKFQINDHLILPLQQKLGKA